ncbi:GyrI-like domain-containing protein [Brachybacterium sp. DNPG3]
MTTMPQPYDEHEPFAEMHVAEVPEIPTAVVSRRSFPTSAMSQLMDACFSHLFRALAGAGVTPIGPAFALHHRMPVDTADVEIGVPLDRPLPETLTLPSGLEVTASVLPAGRAATISHIGGYDALAEKWGEFTEMVGESEEQMTFPFWELYVTPPTPQTNPATLRTDLYTMLEPRP